MSFPGIQVSCCPVRNNGGAPLYGAPLWTETLSATSNDKTTRKVGTEGSLVIFVITPSVDCFIAVGVNPDATQPSGDGEKARLPAPAGVTQTIPGAYGQSVATSPAA